VQSTVTVVSKIDNNHGRRVQHNSEYSAMQAPQARPSGRTPEGNCLGTGVRDGNARAGQAKEKAKDEAPNKWWPEYSSSSLARGRSEDHGRNGRLEVVT
jgi:hypothetical protein